MRNLLRLRRFLRRIARYSYRHEIARGRLAARALLLALCCSLAANAVEPSHFEGEPGTFLRGEEEQPRPLWTHPTKYETALLIASELSLVADMLQTLDIKNCYARNMWCGESNAILGPHPSDGHIIAYFGVSMALNAALWYALPSPWRNAVPAILLVAEVEQIRRNFGMGLSMRF